MNEPLFSPSSDVQRLISTITASKFAPPADEGPYESVDKQPSRPNDRRMTDLNRQQVSDMLSASEAKVDARLANFDTSIKTGFAELSTAMAKQSAAMEKQTDALRVELAKQSGDVRSEMAAIRAEMHKGTADLLKWGATIAFAAVASTVGLLTYINKAGDKPLSVVATQPQAPTVIAVPAGSILLSAPQVPAAAPAPQGK
jgi:hypothetical protein